MIKHLYILDAEDYPICAVNGLQYDSDSYTENFLGISELSFTVNRYIWTPSGLIESTGYSYLKENMPVYVTGEGIFRIKDVVINDDSYSETKQVTCNSCEIELQNRDCVLFYINQGTTASKEMLADGNVSEAGLPKENVSIYNEKNHQLSFLDLVLDELPSWSIGYVDPLVAVKSVLPMDIDSQNVYSVLMEEFSQSNKVIVTFDRKHRKINCYSPERINVINDTTIFIRYENLVNSVNIQRHNEGIFTRFNVIGADGLSIEQVNLGDTRIEDLRWIVSQKADDGANIYVSSALAEKYMNWYEARETNRQAYAEFSKQYNQYVIDINEVQTKDCIDALKIDLGTYKDEELVELKKTYILTCNVLVGTKYAVLNDDGTQKLDSEGYAIIANQEEFEASDMWPDYNIYRNILIKNIEIEQYNRTLSSSQEDLKQDPIDSWETDWDLYGIDSLKAKLEVYNNDIDCLTEAGFNKSWSQATEAEQGALTEEYWNSCYQLYLEACQNYNDCQAAINQRESEKESLTQQQSSIDLQRDALVQDSLKSNPKYGFTQSELDALNRLLIDTDYKNESYLTTSIDDAVTIVDRQQELYNAALQELEVESQEQLGFEITLDNLFNIEEFSHWHEDFKVGNFIRVGIMDNYYIRLRIVTIQRKLFDPESNDITITFSNLLKSNGSLSDINTVFQSAVVAAKNQIEATYRNNRDLSEIYLNDDFLKAMANSGVFQGAMTEAILDTITAKMGVFQVVSSDYVSSDVLEATEASIAALTVDKMFANYSSNLRGDFVGLIADSIRAGTLSVERLIIRPDPNDPTMDGTKSLMFAINNLGDLVSTELDPDIADQYLINGKTIVAHSITADQIHAGTIITDLLSTDCIQSRVYGETDGDVYANTGMWICLEQAGFIKARNFAIDSDGNAYFKGTGSFDGTIIAHDGQIGPWTINSTSIYKGNSEWGAAGANIYLGEDGFSLGDQLTFDNNGTLKIAGTVEATVGKLGPWTVSDAGLYKGSSVWGEAGAENVYLGIEGISFSDKLLFDANGNLEITGTITANEGKIGPWTITKTSIYKGSPIWASPDAGNIYLGEDGFSLGDKLRYNAEGILIIEGDITANSGTFNGIINATGGTFSGNIDCLGVISGAMLEGATGSFSGTVDANEFSINGMRLYVEDRNIPIMTFPTDGRNPIATNKIMPSFTIKTENSGFYVEGNAYIRDLSSNEFNASVISFMDASGMDLYAHTATIGRGEYLRKVLSLDSGYAASETSIAFAHNGTYTWNAGIGVGGIGFSSFGLYHTNNGLGFSIDEQKNVTLYGGLSCPSIQSVSHIEMYAPTPFIDFHYNYSQADYTSRIIEDASGSLNINGVVLKSSHIESAYSTGNWLAGNQGNAIINSTASGYGFNILARMLAPTGRFIMGQYDGDFILAYTRNSTVSAGTNYVDALAKLLNNNGNSLFPGNVEAVSFSNSSLAEIKTEITLVDNALSDIENTDVYSYVLKRDIAQGVHNVKYGFVIGDGYRLSPKLLSQDKDAIELYSAIGLLWKGEQELLDIIEKQSDQIQQLQSELQSLKNKMN